MKKIIIVVMILLCLIGSTFWIGYVVGGQTSKDHTALEDDTTLQVGERIQIGETYCVVKYPQQKSPVEWDREIIPESTAQPNLVNTPELAAKIAYIHILNVDSNISSMHFTVQAITDENRYYIEFINEEWIGGNQFFLIDRATGNYICGGLGE